jgi:hypothetical protein
MIAPERTTGKGFAARQIRCRINGPDRQGGAPGRIDVELPRVPRESRIR